MMHCLHECLDFNLSSALMEKSWHSKGREEFSIFPLPPGESKAQLEGKQFTHRLPRMHSITIRSLSALKPLEIDINTKFEQKRSIQTQVIAKIGSSASVSEDIF